jgi:hypothetical protein
VSYVISGLPRCRTAWLTALLNAHGSRCYHDVYTFNHPVDGSVNCVDPAIACMYPESIVHFDTSICITRLTAASKSALEAWGQMEVPVQVWDVYKRNVQQFKMNAQHHYHVGELESDVIVGEIIKICTNKAPSSELIQIFQHLRIEEHMEKARIASKLRSISQTSE